MGPSIPVRGCTHLPAVAAVQQGDNLRVDTVDSLFYQVCWRETDSNQLHSKQANEAWPSPKKGTHLEMRSWVEQAALEWMVDTTLVHGLQTQVQAQAAFAKAV